MGGKVAGPTPQDGGAAADLLDAWADKGRGRRRRPAGVKQWVERAMREAAAMRNRAEWAGCKPEHLVASYAWCHEQVYGVVPGELLAPNTWMGAVSHARAFAREWFGRPGDEGDAACERAVDFVRWTWNREMGRERRCRDEGREARRIGWRLQFSAGLVTDYRVWLARRGEEIQ